MENKNILGIVTVLVIIAGAVGYAALRPASVIAPGATTLPPGSYTEHAPYYDIAANYASSTPLTGVANTAAVALMQKFVSDTITQFKTDGNFANITPADIKTMGFDTGRKESLQITYLIGSSGRTVSYIFTVYEDTLGAHGNTFFHTFTFDTNPSTPSGQAGVPLALADLFTPGAPYLDELSGIARAKLPGVIGQDADVTFINDGTTPDTKNFQTFFFDNAYLVFLFAPYQVAPYSAGPQTLRIPIASLTSVLKPEYR